MIDLQVKETKLFQLVKHSAVKSFLQSPRSFSEADMEFLDNDQEVANVVNRAVWEYHKQAWVQIYERDKCYYHEHSDGGSCSADDTT